MDDLIQLANNYIILLFTYIFQQLVNIHGHACSKKLVKRKRSWRMVAIKVWV